MRPCDRWAAWNGACGIPLSRTRRVDRACQCAAWLAARGSRIGGLSASLALWPAWHLRYPVYANRDGDRAMCARHANRGCVGSPKHRWTLARLRRCHARRWRIARSDHRPLMKIGQDGLLMAWLAAFGRAISEVGAII